MSDSKSQRGFFSKLRHLASVIVGRDARRRARSLAAKLEKEKQRANELGETCKSLCPAAMTALLDANARDGISPFKLAGRGLYLNTYEVVKQALPTLDWSSDGGGKADLCLPPPCAKEQGSSYAKTAFSAARTRGRTPPPRRVIATDARSCTTRLASTSTRPAPAQ